MSDPIQTEQRASMNELAELLDQWFNGEAKGKDRKVAFFLLTAHFSEIDQGRVNYISNGERSDIVNMMKETVARFEGRYVEAPGAVQ